MAIPGFGAVTGIVGSPIKAVMVYILITLILSFGGRMLYLEWKNESLKKDAILNGIEGDAARRAMEDQQAQDRINEDISARTSEEERDARETTTEIREDVGENLDDIRARYNEELRALEEQLREAERQIEDASAANAESMVLSVPAPSRMAATEERRSSVAQGLYFGGAPNEIARDFHRDVSVAVLDGMWRAYCHQVPDNANCTGRPAIAGGASCPAP